MAITYLKVPDGDNVEGKLRTTEFDLTLDNSYAAGGIAIPAATIGFTKIVKVIEVGGNVASTGVLFAWDTTNGKLVVYYPSGGAAAPAAVAAPIVVTTPDAGATTMTGSAAKPALSGVVTAGLGKEVANATDLSSITVRLKFYGF